MSPSQITTNLSICILADALMHVPEMHVPILANDRSRDHKRQQRCLVVVCLEMPIYRDGLVRRCKVRDSKVP